MDQRIAQMAEGVVDEVASAAKSTMADFRDTTGSLANKAGGVATSARDAIEEMRRIMSDFAEHTGERAIDAANSAKRSGSESVEQFVALVEELRGIGRGGVDNVAAAVARRPATALAIAAGVGLLLGLASRPGSKT